MSVLHDPDLVRLLADLHARSDQQIAEMASFYAQRSAQVPSTAEHEAAELKAFRRDKLVALDRDKAEFCYQLCRAGNARRIVEAGTSYGISTLYLAAAVRDNLRAAGGANLRAAGDDNSHAASGDNSHAASGDNSHAASADNSRAASGDNSRAASGDGVVIGTEYEPEKARAARAHFAQAGLSDFIELREGDLRETLRQIDGPVDFMLVDIWIPMARPALELVAPHLRPGAIVICDNTQQHRDAYAEYFAFLEDPANGFRTMTLPFDGGLELSVRCRP
jgi:predicted O-methyltransferase YrrM